jgi:hypothetical protein
MKIMREIKEPGKERIGARIGRNRACKIIVVDIELNQTPCPLKE